MNIVILMSFIIFVSINSFAAPTSTGLGVKVPGGKKMELQKVPKSLFLVEKAKLDVNVGEPQFYPIESQLRTVTNEPILHNLDKLK
jgi:hypothetical protein